MTETNQPSDSVIRVCVRCGKDTDVSWAAVDKLVAEGRNDEWLCWECWGKGKETT